MINIKPKTLYVKNPNTGEYEPIIGVKGPAGEPAPKIVSTTLKGQDEDGGNVYIHTYDDGSTQEFTAPKGATGEKGDVGGLDNITQTAGDSEDAVMSQKATTEIFASVHVITTQSEGSKFYFEKTTNETYGIPVYFNFTGSIYFRGAYSVNATFADLKAFLPDNVCTSPSGVECLQIPHNSALYVHKDETFSIAPVSTIDEGKVAVFTSANGIVTGGIGLKYFQEYVNLLKYSEYSSTSHNRLIALETFAILNYGVDVYFEGNTNGYNGVYFKATPVDRVSIYLRGNDASENLAMQDIMNAVPDNIVTSPNGVEECLHIPHNKSLVYNNKTFKCEIASSYSLTEYQIPIFKASTGAVKGGIGLPIYERYITEKMLEDATGESIAAHFEDEVNDCVDKLSTECAAKSFVFALVTDSHYDGTNNWQNTVKNIGAVNKAYKLDAIYHLGDMVDGDQTKSVTGALLGEMRNALYAINPESYMLTGNHDDNSFSSNNEYQYTKAEQYAIVCRYKDVDVVRSSNNLYWYKDIPSFGLRFICLDSHLGGDTNGLGSSWGYPTEEIEWVRDVALETTNQVVFLSHIPLTQAYNYGNSEVDNAESLRTVIEEFKANGGAVVGFFHGHTHWDFIGMKNADSFNEISTGCSYATKPNFSYVVDGAVLNERENGTVTEDLWDIVIIQPEERRVKMIRFGAGDDREISY